jgi:hypothetical protein
MRNDHVGLQSDQLFRQHAKPIRAGASETHVDADVPSFRPAESFQLPTKFRDARLRFWIVLGQPHEHADLPHALALLRARRTRPSRRADE